MKKKDKASQRQLLDSISTNMELLRSANLIGVALHGRVLQSNVLAGSDFRLMTNGGSTHALLLDKLIDLLQGAIEKIEAAERLDQEARTTGAPDEVAK